MKERKEILDQKSSMILEAWKKAKEQKSFLRPHVDLQLPDFNTWLKIQNPSWNWDWDYLLLIQYYLDKVTKGDIKRLMVFAPPRHGKSMMTTVRWPAWRLAKNPEMRIVIAAYNQHFVNNFSRAIRRIAEPYVTFSPEMKQVEHWETESTGYIKAVGVGAGVTGMGADLIIIDDPIKSREEANSQAYRDRLWNWYKDDLWTRQEPNCAIVLIQTRWHEDDLAGRLLFESESEGEEWTILSLPALSEGEGDLLNRPEGKALCPPRYNEEYLENAKRTMGDSFYALYQQRPRPKEGSFFKREWFEGKRKDEGGFERQIALTRLPSKFKSIVRYWDKAITEGGGDYTVGVLMAVDFDGIYYVIDIERGKWSLLTRNDKMKLCAQRDRDRFGRVVIHMEQEPGSGGKESAMHSIALLAGFNVHASPVSGDKEERASGFAAQAEAGNVRLVAGKWNLGFLDELCDFPVGRNDDQVDASSGAFNKLSLRKSARVIKF